MIYTENYSITGSNGKLISMDVTINSVNDNIPLVIFIHGFKGFKDWGAHHLTARYFAQHGYRFLKFNLSHSGVNPAEPNDVTDFATFAANTFSKEILDIDLVVNYAVNHLNAKQIYLIGHSRGGGLAILKAAHDSKIKALITWSSIADFSSLWKVNQEESWRNEGKIYVTNARTKEKMPLNVSLLEDFTAHKETLNILNAANEIHIPWLIVQGTADVNVPVETAQQLAETNPASQFIKIEGANHVYGASHPYTEETLPAHLLEVCEKSVLFLNQLHYAKFNFSNEVCLENQRVLLRPLAYTDQQHLLHFSLNEPTIWKYSSLRADGKKNLESYIDLALTARQEEKEYPFIVLDKLKNEYAGSTRFYDIQLKNQSLQLGFTWYGSAFQGTGLNKHCKFLLLEFAFEKMNMQRVEFRADNANERSIAAMKSIGCTVEGVLRSHGIRPDGTRRDSIVLSILKEEWENKIKENLLKQLI